MRMKKNQFLFLTVLAFDLTACSTTHHTAPVVDRAPGATSNETAKVTSATKPGGLPLADAAGSYTVKKGDTVLRIALDNGQSYRDIVAWNNLANPNDIKVDQVLRVSPPDGGSGEARATAVESRAVSAVNGLANKNSPRADKKPYSEGALEELQKADISAPVLVASLKEAPKVGEKPATAATANVFNTVNIPDETVSWMWPTEGKVLATFDGSKSKGIDISGKSGQKVVAAGAGKVMYAGSDIRGYGNLVIIKHTSNLLSAYAHNKSIMVKEGQSVSKGESIAEMGNSDSDAVKLHFEIRQQGKPVDPSKFLPNH